MRLQVTLVIGKRRVSKDWGTALDMVKFISIARKPIYKEIYTIFIGAYEAARIITK